MKNRRTAALALGLCLCAMASAASPAADTLLTDDPLLAEADSIISAQKFVINDYSLVGVEYGVTRNSMSFNPKYSQKAFMSPGYVGVTYTRYYKMFGYMPYFGLQVGLFYGNEGYQFKENKETGSIQNIHGAVKAVYDVVEMPLMMEAHVDFNNFKILADVGPYAGYRLNISRFGDDVDEKYRNAFMDTDRRWDYGLYGGVGVGLVFSPVEFHLKLRVRYSWSTLYDPDYHSPYYYRFAYPFDMMLSAGVQFQLTKRSGKTKSMLRREAYESVYKPASSKKK